MFIGLILVAIGVIALLVKLGVLAGSIWNYSWPVILIILGLLSLTRSRFGHHHMWRFCCPPEKDKDTKQ